MWREMEDLPERDGAWLVWMSVPVLGSNYCILRRRKARNGFFDTIDGLFAWDQDGKPVKWQELPVAPNEQ